MTPMTTFLTFVGICVCAAQITRFLVWVDQTGCER